MEYPPSPSPAATLAALVVVLLLAAAGTLLLSTASSGVAATGEAPQKLVEPKPGENVFWPYTSRSRSPEGRTLAVNVVVYGNAETVRFYLTDRSGATWNETEKQWRDLDPDEGEHAQDEATNQTIVEWAAARGAKRYLYVHNRALTEERPNSTTRRPHRAPAFTGDRGPEAGGMWVEETDQLHDGRYFGSRYHLRLYESPFESDEWVAIQAHSDHWDWFRLRHTVHDTEDAQNYVESEFMGHPAVEVVWRMYLDNEGGVGSDGWASVVDFKGGSPSPRDAEALGVAGLAVLVGVWRGRVRSVLARPAAGPAGLSLSTGRLRSAVHSWDRLDRQQSVVVLRALSYASLFVALFGLYLSVRLGGVALEGRFSDASPKLIAAGLYPVVSVGLPLAAYLFGRNLDPVRSFAAAAVGLGAAVVVDYHYLGVTVLPLDVVLHRLGVAVAVGFVAAGAVSREAPTPTVNRLVGAGVLLWVYLLLAPLVGWM